MPEQIPVAPPLANSRSLKILIAVVIVLVVALVAWLIFKPSKKPATTPPPTADQTQNQNQPQPPPTAVPVLETTQTEQGQLPPAFPTGMPVEKNPLVVQNSSTLNKSTGKTDASYIYVTKNSIDQNFTAFTKYLSKNGWKVSTTVDQPQFKAINASKGATTISIVLDYKSAAPKNEVMIDYVY